MDSPGYTAWHGKARQPGYPTSFGGLARHGGQPIQLALVARLSGPVTRGLRTQKKRVYFLLLRGYVDPSQIGPRQIMSVLSKDECRNTILSLAA